MLHAPGRPDVLVAAEHDERFEPVLPRAIGIRQAVADRVLAGQERHDVRARDIRRRGSITRCRRLSSSLQAHGAVGEEDERAGSREAAHGMVGVDPGVHARRATPARRAADAVPPRRPVRATSVRALDSERSPRAKSILEAFVPVPPSRARSARVPSVLWRSRRCRLQSTSSRGSRGRLSPRLTLLVKRDDAIAFGFGGNKVRKLQLVAARARPTAPTRSSRAAACSRITRARPRPRPRGSACACILVANGAPPERPTGNALLARLARRGDRYVASRDAREPAMQAAAPNAVPRAGARS